MPTHLQAERRSSYSRALSCPSHPRLPERVYYLEVFTQRFAVSQVHGIPVPAHTDLLEALLASCKPRSQIPLPNLVGRELEPFFSHAEKPMSRCVVAGALPVCAVVQSPDWSESFYHVVIELLRVTIDQIFATTQLL